jgi:hypothetical protein
MITSDDLIAAGRVLPEDYPEKARDRIRAFFGLTEDELSAWFARLRRPYDDPRRTPSKRALLKTVAERRRSKGLPLYPE